MISKIAGIALKKDTRTKQWWMKLAVAIVLSNIFFFVLFSRSETEAVVNSTVPEGWVELHIRAELLTPFHSGKKVLLIQRNARKQVQAMLESTPLEPEGRYTVLVKETEAASLLQYETWEIVPFLKTLSFAPVPTGAQHEIRY